MSSGLFSLPEVPTSSVPPSWSPRLELLVVKPWPPDSLGPRYRGDVHSLERDSGRNWHIRDGYTADGEYDDQGDASVQPRSEIAYRDPCWFHATNGNYYGVAVRSGQVKFFTNPRTRVYPVQDGGSSIRCGGAPGFIQSRFFTREGAREWNFELIVPLESGGMLHMWVDNADGAPRQRAPRWNRAQTFGTNRVHGVRLLHSDWGNLELIAWEETPSGPRLVHYFQRNSGGSWIRAVELPNSDSVGGMPGFIQSSFGTENGGHGNFEVIAPARNGGLLGWWRQNGPPWTWTPYSDSLGDANQRLRALHLIQDFSVRVGDAPVVHKPFTAVGETFAPNGIGFGRLIEYTKAAQPPWNFERRDIEPAGSWP